MQVKEVTKENATVDDYEDCKAGGKHEYTPICRKCHQKESFHDHFVKWALKKKETK